MYVPTCITHTGNQIGAHDGKSRKNTEDNEVINNSPFVEKMFESLDAGIISDK